MIDKLLTEDLAVLARDNRRQLPALEVSLRAIASDEPRSADVILVATSRLYVHRVARLAGGATALGCALFVLALACLPFGKDVMHAHGCVLTLLLAPVNFVFGRTPFEIGVDAIVLACFAGALASRLAERRLERRLRRSADALATVRELAGRIDVWSSVLVFGGISVLLSVLAVPMFALGLGCTGKIELDAWGAFAYMDDPRIGPFMTTVLSNTMLAAAIALVGSLVVGHALRRGARWVRRLEHPMVAAGGVLFALFVIALGFRFEIGDVGDAFCGTAHSAIRLRIALTVGATLSVLLAMTSLVLHRRHRERDEIR